MLGREVGAEFDLGVLPARPVRGACEPSDHQRAAGRATIRPSARGGPQPRAALRCCAPLAGVLCNLRLQQLDGLRVLDACKRLLDESNRQCNRQCNRRVQTAARRGEDGSRAVGREVDHGQSEGRCKRLLDEARTGHGQSEGRCTTGGGKGGGPRAVGREMRTCSTSRVSRSSSPLSTNELKNARSAAHSFITCCTTNFT